MVVYHRKKKNPNKHNILIRLMLQVSKLKFIMIIYFCSFFYFREFPYQDLQEMRMSWIRLYHISIGPCQRSMLTPRLGEYHKKNFFWKPNHKHQRRKTTTRLLMWQMVILVSSYQNHRLSCQRQLWLLLHIPLHNLRKLFRSLRKQNGSQFIQNHITTPWWIYMHLC